MESSKRVLLKNAKIYDGSGTAAFLADVLIEGERIARVAPKIPEEEAYETVELQGLSLAPGFIDAHSHIGISEERITATGDECNEGTTPITPKMYAIP